MKNTLLALKNRAAFTVPMLAATLVTTPAFAASGKMGAVFADEKFQVAVTLGFGLFAFYKWIEYFAGFSLQSALTNIVLPGILTFLTFQWPTVLGWIGLM